MTVLNRDFGRATSAIGRLRTGEARTGRGPGRPLDTWRLTSSDEALIAAASDKYGGKPGLWESAGEDCCEVVTEAPELRVALVGLQAEWRLWSAGGLQRRCDGQALQTEAGTADCLCPLNVYDMRALASDGQACVPSIGVRVLLAIRKPMDARPWLLVSHSYDLAGDLDDLFAEIEKLSGAPPAVQTDMRTDRLNVPVGVLALERVRSATNSWIRPVLKLTGTVPAKKLPEPVSPEPDPEPEPERSHPIHKGARPGEEPF